MRVSDATIYRVLKRHGVSRLPGKVGCRKVHTKRYHKQVPGHHIQMDVKFLIFKSKAGKKIKRYQYTAIDDATRVRALKIYDRHTQKHAIDFVDHVVAKFPFRIAWKLCTSMTSRDVTETLELALQASGCDQADVVQAETTLRQWIELHLKTWVSGMRISKRGHLNSTARLSAPTAQTRKSFISC